MKTWVKMTPKSPPWICRRFFWANKILFRVKLKSKFFDRFNQLNHGNRGQILRQMKRRLLRRLLWIREYFKLSNSASLKIKWSSLLLVLYINMVRFRPLELDLDFFFDPFWVKKIAWHKKTQILNYMQSVQNQHRTRLLNQLVLNHQLLQCSPISLPAQFCVIKEFDYEQSYVFHGSRDF